MHQTRQFAKRRPQSPMLNQSQAVEGLQVGTQKIPRSGLAIQSSAPIHIRTFKAEQNHVPVQEQSFYEPSEQEIHHFQQKSDLNHGQDHYGHAESHGHHHHENKLQEPAHIHDNYGHYHDQHGYNHDSYGHDALHHQHDHDHHHGNHHHHGHHDHHHDNHHDHHDHHDHHHSHSGANFPQVYTQPLPSFASIFATLVPSQKAIFTCFVLHFLIGILVWWSGIVRESLAVVGFSYLVLFDAFGTLNSFISSVLHLNPAFKIASTKRPFGVRRFEIVFALANTIFLLFGTMYTTKESLEHLLLENHHAGGDHHAQSYSFGLLFVLFLAIGASLFSNASLKNHENLVNLMKKLPQTQQDHGYHDIKSLSNNNFTGSLATNIYSSSIIGSGLIIFLMYLFGLSSSAFEKFIAFAEAALMFYLGGPTAAALARVLLQTMPDSLIGSIELKLRLIQQVPQVISVDKAHFWQNAYGTLIGTFEVHARPEADEDAIINASFDIIEPMIRETGGELTISVTKM